MDNLYEKENITFEKADSLIKSNMPSFTSRFFRYFKENRPATSYYSYALSLAKFFEYLKSIGYDVPDMKLSDLESVTSFDIENYLKYDLFTYDKKGNRKARAVSSIQHRLSVVKSFYLYFYKNDLITINPAIKVNGPVYQRRPLKCVKEERAASLIDYVSNGSLPSDHAAKIQENIRSRDIAILLLISVLGLSSMECENLNLSDVDLESCFLYATNRKGKRKVRFPNTVRSVLKNYLEERLCITPFSDSEDAFFLSTRRSRLKVRTIQEIIQKYSYYAFDGDNISARELRATYKNNIYRNYFAIHQVALSTGLSPDTIQQLFVADFNTYE